MFKKYSLACIAMLCMSVGAKAQQPCGTDDRYWQIVKQHPEVLEYEAQFESQLSSQLKSYGKTTLAASDTTIFDVPIVIHIVHDYGAEYLPDNDIYDAAKYWAVVFMGANDDTSFVIPPFKKWTGNPRMRLHLATKDPAGNPTKGVVRHFSYLTDNADDLAKYQPWPNNKYINIWFIRSFGTSGAAAYAYYPGAAASMPYYDGVISLYSYLNSSKTIPHELGHVLNLQHVWGNTNNPAVACGNDLVDDTPPTKGHLPGCTAAAIYDTACATGYIRTYTSSLGTDSIVNYPDTVNAQNIMDYTYCALHFTKGQCERMRNALTSATAGRNNLITMANLNATGALEPMPDLPPIADFSEERATGAGVVSDPRTRFLTFNNTGSFLFRNRSWNDTVTDVRWTFSNGATTPTSTSMTSVANKFSVPGWVTVTLISNANSGSDTLVKTNAVYAADTTAYNPTTYFQGFATPSEFANWPMINFYDNQYKWAPYTGTSYGGDDACVRYRSYDTTNKRSATPLGDYDDMYTPAFNLAGVTGNYYLNFWTAGAKASGSGLGWGTDAVQDSLQIEVSTNGGARWYRIGGINGNDLANNGTKPANWVPTGPTQWKPRGISIPAAYRTGNTFFRFRYWPGNIGNNLYFDNFHLFPFPTEMEDVASQTSLLKIYPNPATDGCSIVFKTGNSGSAAIVIKDITGRTVYQSQQSYTANTMVQENVARTITPAAGMYLVTVSIDGNTATEKLVVY